MESVHPMLHCYQHSKVNVCDRRKTRTKDNRGAILVWNIKYATKYRLPY